MEMEDREDLNSILPYLPLLLRSSTLFWPSQAVEILKLLAAGPHHSHLHSGDLLFRSITDLRRSLSLSADPLAFSAHQGYALFFDQLISREESKKWFEGIVPALANLLLRFPSLLESHYQNADNLINGVKTGLRLLNSQEAGLVVLSQELIAALLGCSLFCLFPITIRGDKHLPTINFDHLFASLHDSCDQKQQGKIKCIIHYFERICAQIPGGSVSFERNVLPLEHRPLCVSYPDANFWSGSLVPLCKFEVCSFGLIEDQSSGALEVDFANKYFGGGALHRGCVQEEIRFMINPELIAGMLFLPALADNESIEVVGTERFSNYTGYASSFRFSGDYVDKKEMNSLGRRKTRIVAIDALCCPEMRQYKIKYLLREINKAFCGFMDQSKYYQYDRQLLKNDCSGDEHDVVMKDPNYASTSDIGAEAASTSIETFEESVDPVPKTCQEKGHQSLKKRDDVGIATGNWGCGAFGGDPELKTIIQWLAASQGRRPFIAYYTFGLRALQNLDQVTEWILVHKWTVGDLWNMLVEYCMQVSKGETNDGFFTWLLPSLSSHDEGPAILLRVDQSGKGDFTKIQDAINAVPSNNSELVFILVKPGIYKEKVIVPADKPYITISGTKPSVTIITWNDGGDIFDSPTFSVLASDFVARYLTIENTYGSSGKAVALRVSGDKAAFYGCRIVSVQDTLLADTGRHYYSNCYIEGATDFICGNAASLFEKCHIHSLAEGTGSITAQRRESPSEETGFVFLGCNISGVRTALLGRPWGSYSRVIFAFSYMSSAILPQGWDDWGNSDTHSTVYYGQYKCYGRGAVMSKRVQYARNLTSLEAEPFLTKDFIGAKAWIRSVPTKFTRAFDKVGAKN